MLPNEEGEIWHNTFYNEISSNNIENLDKLINEWPHNLEELDEVLSKAYGELKLKNVWLKNETEIFIENKLINLRFFSDTSRQEQIISDVDPDNTRERIELTVESMRLLKADYSYTDKVDGKFIFLAKFIAKNIHVLKQQLKSTHDRLPWEQMEFCLVAFIASYTKRQEINLVYRATLNKKRILHHIESFANKLEAQKDKLRSSKHEQVVTEILNSYPQFEELYIDNQRIREVQYLVKISDHIKNKALMANPVRKDGQLIIAKILKLIGEYLKSTLEFSNLFNNIKRSEQENTTKIIVELRNSLSLLANSLPERSGTDEHRDLNFSLNVQEDVRKVGDVIARIVIELNTNEEDIFVKNELISLSSFFKDPSYKSDNDKNTLIQLILENISLLRRNYSNMEEVDEKFICTTKCIEHSISKIRVERRQIKSNWDRFSRREMQFCLNSFVISYTKKQEMNPFYRALLNKFRILSHLEHFAKKLEDENIENEQVVTKKSIPEFKDLYKDYQQIRDIHSLRKISHHIELTLSADPNDTVEPLIITRVLQVTGEHLKNTSEFPKLSDAISKRLVLSLPETARRIIIELRDLLSHDDNDTLSKRRKIEKKQDDNFFFNVKNDMKKVGDVITDILYNNKMEIIRIFLLKINLSNLDQIKEVVEMLKNVQLDENVVLKNFKIMEHDQLEKLLNKVSDKISDKTDFEEDLFNQIKSEIKWAGSRSNNFRSDYVKGIKNLYSLSINLASITHSRKVFEFIMQSLKAIDNITSQIDPNRWKKISDLSIILFKIIWLRKPYNFDFDEVFRSITEICYIAKFGTRNIKWIEKFRVMLIEKVNFNPKKKLLSQTDNVSEEKYKNQLAMKLSELDKILVENSFCGLLTEKLHKIDKKMQVVVEMVILDIMTILGISKNNLENNLLLLDDNAPLLYGRSLRNHLAHDNALYDVLFSDPSIAVILNAKKLTEENIIESKKKIGTLIKDDLLKLREKYNRDLLIISNQERMFDALERGNLETLKDCLKKGGDVNARSINSWTTLHFAANGPSLEVVQFILDQNLKYISKDFNGQSPLHVAAAKGRSSIVEFFVRGILFKVDDVNNRGETPLHLAAKNGHMKTVEVLLKNAANTVTQDVRGHSAVHYAIWNNHTDVAIILLKQDTNFDNKTIDGYTPLHIAADCGRLKLVKFLLANNVQINVKTYKDMTPLHLAALNGHLEIVTALIEEGADVNTRELYNLTPLNYAIENDHEKIVNILLKYGGDVNAFDKTNKNSLLHYAAKYGHLYIVITLLRTGAEVNFRNIENKTPLHFAAGIGHFDILCEILLEHRCEINAKDNNDNTPLHSATDTSNIKAVELLINHGADINAKGSDGKTPLHIAVLRGEDYISKILINTGAEINAQDTYGSTILHAAARNGNKNVIANLIQNKANVNAATNYGMTPLHEAVLRGHKEAINLLVKNKAEINAKANNGLTMLEAAVMGGYTDVVILLIKYHAHVDKMGMSQSTPLYLASEVGHKEIVEILLKNGADVNIINFHKETPLISAIRFNHKKIVEVLIKFGAIVAGDALKEAICTGHTNIVKILLSKNDIVNIPVYIENTRTTPLHLAVNEGYTEIVKVLIKNGADLNSRTDIKGNPVTPLYFAAQKGDEEIVEILIAGGANVNFEFNTSPFHIAATMGHSTVVNLLLQYQTDINLKDENDETPLELAVKNGHLQVVKMILHDKQVLDMKVTGINGNTTLLHLASEQSNLQMVEYLVDEGCDINDKDASGAKAIHIAAKYGHKDIVNYFLKTKGLSTDDPGGQNQTLLYYAVMSNRLEVVNYLIAQGADVNAKDDNGLTALHIAVQFGYKEIIHALLKNGAMYNAVNIYKLQDFAAGPEVYKLLTSIDRLFSAVQRNKSLEVQYFVEAGALINTKNTESLTPLHYAAWKGYEEIVNILLENKANPNVVCKTGRTPLHYAAKFSQSSKFSHLKIVKALLSNFAIYNPVSDGGETPSTLTQDESITSLFKLVDDSFKRIEKGDHQVIDDLNNIKDKDTIKAIMNARNIENKTLVVVAMHSNYSKVEQLKDISQGDTSAQIKAALELFNKGNYPKALYAFNGVFKKRKDLLGSDNPGTLDVQTYVAQVLFAQGDYQEALNIYKEIYQKQKEILRFSSKDTLTIRSTIAVVLHSLQKYEEAFNIHQEVYQIQKELLGPNNLNTLVTQVHMALVLRMQGKYEEALNIIGTVLGKLKHLLKLLKVLKSETAPLSQSNIELLKNYEYILETEKKTLGIDYSDTSSSSFNIALEHIRLKKYPEALKAHEKVLNIQKCVLGPNHPKTLHTQYKIAEVLYIQEKWIDAFKAYKEVLDPLKTVCGQYHPSVLDSLEKLEILNLRNNSKRDVQD